MQGYKFLPHSQLVVFFPVRFHRDDCFFLVFLVVDFGGTYGRLANSVLRTYPFFGAPLRIFVVSDYICPVFHYGVSVEKNGGTYGSLFRSAESFGHEIAM